MYRAFNGISLLVSAGLAMALSAPLHAQVSSGSVSGTVVDVQGAAVPSAKVTLTDQDRATTRTVNASAEGNFTFTPVNPSTYRLSIEAPGFKKLEKVGIILYANDQLEVPDLKLSIGAVNETVTIQARFSGDSDRNGPARHRSDRPTSCGSPDCGIAVSWGFSR